MNINDLFRQSAPAASAAPATQKTASDNTSSAIKAAMAEALAPTEKVASEAPNSPEVTLLKLAQDLAARDAGFRAYLSWELGLVAQLEREGNVGIRLMPAQ